MIQRNQDPMAPFVRARLAGVPPATMTKIAIGTESGFPTNAVDLPQGRTTGIAVTSKDPIDDDCQKYQARQVRAFALHTELLNLISSEGLHANTARYGWYLQGLLIQALHIKSTAATQDCRRRTGP